MSKIILNRIKREGLLRQNDFTSLFEVKDDQIKDVFNVLSTKKDY